MKGRSYNNTDPDLTLTYRLHVLTDNKSPEAFISGNDIALDAGSQGGGTGEVSPRGIQAPVQRHADDGPLALFPRGCGYFNRMRGRGL